MKLQGRLALITGANRGIGLAIAKAYAAEGARCVLAGRNVQALEKVAKEINATVLPMDLERPEDLRATARSFAAATPKLDILVANAAVLGARKPLREYPFDVWMQSFQTNLHANLILLQELDAPLRKSDAGRVVLVSSGAGRFPKASGGSYAVTKAALDTLAQVYSQEVAGTAIKVNVVNPGPTRTPMRAAVAPQEDPMTLKTPDDLAPLFVELASPECTRSGEWIAADAWLKERN